MGKQIYAITVFIGLAVAALAIGAFGIFFNKGTLTVTARAPYTIDVEKIFQHCLADRCSMELAPGLYTMTVFKEGYKPADIAVTVKRWRTLEYAVDLAFIPIIREPATDAFPIGKDITGGFSLDAGGVLRNMSEEQVTVFPDPPGEEAVIAAQNGHLIVYELMQGGMFAYHVDTIARRKTRILMQEGISRVIWGPYPWVVFDGDSDADIFALNVENGERRELPAYPIQHFAALGDFLLFFDLASDVLSISRYDFETGKTVELTTLAGTGTIPNEYAQAEDGKSLFFRIGATWRELIIGE